MLFFFVRLIYTLILFNTPFLVNCSLLSRIKNPYQYSTETDIKILPQDYEYMDEKGVKTVRTVESTVEGTMESTEYEDEGDEDSNNNASRPVYLTLVYRPTSLFNSSTIRPTMDFAWPSASFLRVDTNAALTEPTTPNSAPRRTWKSYFPLSTASYPVTDKYYTHTVARQNFNAPSKTTLRDTGNYEEHIIRKVLGDLANKTKKESSEVNHIYEILDDQVPEIQVMSPKPKTTRVLLLRIIFHADRSTRSSTYTPRPNNSKTTPRPRNKIIKKPEKISKCYECGITLNDKLGNSECYDNFNGPGNIRVKRKKMKKTCDGEKLIGGCFKRFLDIGTNYYERGCRSDPPQKGGTYASLRYQKLEMILRNTTEGCIISPAASLIPFAKAVSLYANFQVCVCKKRFCNAASTSKFDSFQMTVTFLFYLFFYSCHCC